MFAANAARIANKPEIVAPKPAPNPFKSKFEMFAANAARIAEEKKKADEAQAVKP